jgi:NADP-dependent 3-hydroxy acid dehydrogenase YdfG
VRTTLIAPGMVETAGFSHDLDDGLLTAEDIARAVLFAVGQPPHVDLNEILIRPTAQDS